MGCPPSITVYNFRLSSEANFVTASPPESGSRSASASIIGMAAFPIPKPNTRPSMFGRCPCTALNGSTASSAAERICRMRWSFRLCVAKRFISTSVIITERFYREMMAKPKVFVARVIPDKGFDMIKEFCDVYLWLDELPPTRAELLQHVRGVDGLLCLLTDKIDGEVMDEAGPQLKVISNYAVGVDNIDVPAATARRIPVGNTPDVLTDATADFAFALMMAVARRINDAERYIRDGKWKTWGPMTLLGVDIKGATLGLVGLGRIGKAVARRALGFDMRVIYYDPTEKKPDPHLKVTRVDFETLLEESDFISLHT